MEQLPTENEINYILNETIKYRTIQGQLKKTIREPILLLIRTTGNIDVYEDIRATEYKFEHSDGTERTILLKKSPLRLKRGKDTIRVHIADENNGTALPQQPLVDSLDLKNHMDQVLATQKELDIKLQEAKSTKILYIFLGIAIILGIIFLFGRPLLEVLFNSGKETGKIILQNVTIDQIGG